MNYPPGMTKRDWGHIDGEQHYKQCPLNEDSQKPADYLSHGVASMLRTVTNHLASIAGYETRIISAADCAAAARRVAEARAWILMWEEEFGSVDEGDPACVCDQIRADAEEAAIERRYEIRNDSRE